MNINENPGFVEPFMKEHQFTFPVVPAYAYIEDTLHSLGIPQNWIVDANGVVRLKGLGYDPSEEWDDAMVEAIEKNKPEGQTSVPTRPPKQ
ncbi:MAG: hypothetical protein ABSA41_19945 [Terriglobia bacterium]